MRLLSSDEGIEDVIARLRAAAPPPEPPKPVNLGALRLSRCDARGVPNHYQVREIIRDGARETKAVSAVASTVSAYMKVRSDEKAVGSLPTLMVLCGPPRTGKTVALSFAVAAVDASALYVTTYQLADYPRMTRSYEDSPWNRLRQVDVLAIDELHADETVIPRVKSLIYERWDNGRCTLLGGNLTVGVFMERYLCDPALRRRVAEEYESGRLRHLEFAATVKELG